MFIATVVTLADGDPDPYPHLARRWHAGPGRMVTRVDIQHLYDPQGRCTSTTPINTGVMAVSSGVYALRHLQTGSVYIGSSVDLPERRKQWWRKLNHPQSLPLRLRSITKSRYDWEFVVLWSRPGLTEADLERAEQAALTQAMATAPHRVLNALSAMRRFDRELEVDGKFNSLRGWEAATGVPKTTIQARISSGWTPAQAVGLTPPPETVHHNAKKVAVYDGGLELTQREAARRLGCEVKTLAARLQRYRVPGGVGTVQLAELQALSAKYRR